MFNKDFALRILGVSLFLFLQIATIVHGGWRVHISPLPNFVYVDEERLVTVTATYDGLTNALLWVHVLPGNRIIPLQVSAQDPLSRVTSTNGLPSISSGTAIIPFRIGAEAVRSSAPVTLSVVAADDVQLATERYVFAGGTSRAMTTHRQGFHYFDDAGRRVVWVNTLKTWQERRKWVLPRRAARLIHRRSEPVHWLVSAADRTALATTTDASSACLSDIPNAAPLESILDLPLLLRNLALADKGRPNLLVSLPSADMHARLSQEDIVRAIDLSAQWLRDQHGEMASLVLVTPFPWPGQCGISETYAAAIREAGRHAELSVIDVHEAIRGVGDWESLYTTDGVIFREFPLQDGQNLAARLFANVFPQLHLRPPGPQSEGSRPSDETSSPPSSRNDTWVTANVAAPSLYCTFPGEAAQWGLPPVASTGVSALALDVALPQGAPTDISATLRMKDKDGLWFQLTSAASLLPGQTNRLVFPVSGSAVPIAGGTVIWDDYYRGQMQAVGLGLFSGTIWTGRITIAHAAARIKVPQSQPPRILEFRAPPPDVTCTGRYEMAFVLDNTDDLNPFDPDEIEVQARFESPSGKRTTVDGFFQQPFVRKIEDDREVLVPVGRPGWRIRFTPTEAGLYRYTVHFKTSHGAAASAPLNFLAQPSTRSAFVRTCVDDPRLFELSDGTPFYPIGLNIHAPFDVRAAEMEHRNVLADHGTFAYDRYFERLAATGANACVVWLAPWWLEIEWSREWPGFGGLGDFNLGNAWRLDYLLQAAERHGLRLHLVLENHGKYSLWVDSQWGSNPYNNANGGMLERPEDFFTSSVAAAAYRRKLRYLVARYASSPALLGFELFGEMNLVGSSARFANHPSHARWVADTVRFFHVIDPYRHLLSVHYSNDWRTIDPAVAGLCELDYLVGDIYKPGGSIVDWVIETAHSNCVYGKPTFSTEFGGYWNGSPPARLEADLHAGLWSNFMTPTAGAPFFWWFEFVDRNDLYPHLQAFAAYAKGENRSGIASTEEPQVLHTGNRKVRALLLRRHTRPRETADTLAWLWVFDAAAMEVLPEERFAPVITDASLRLELPAGAYTVEYWDTYSGRVISVSTARALPDASLVINLPDFRRDIAVKIRYQSENPPLRIVVKEVQE